MTRIDLSAQVEVALATKGGCAALANAFVDHCDDFPWASAAYMVENIAGASRLMAEQWAWAEANGYKPHLVRYPWFPETLALIDQGRVRADA